MRNYDLIRETTAAAADRWPMVLSQLGIDVPRSPRQHASCPACGGKDRFRFDDKGRGSFFCNQCGAGDGLDLIQKVNQCGTTEAARMAADVLGIDYRATETDQKAASQRRQQLDEQRYQHEQERQQKEVEEAKQRRESFVGHYQRLAAQTRAGESEYLIARGLNGFTLPCLSDGSILLSLVDESGGVAAAQTITPQGEKKVLYGSAKRGAWHLVNQPQEVKEIIIGEGLATTLTAHLMRPDALAVVALDAGNLPPVAEAMRSLYPNATFIIAGDNDWHEPGKLDASGKPKVNSGKVFAERAAEAVNGSVSLPPTSYKADWDDYRQQNGLEAAAKYFASGMYQPQEENMGAQLEVIEGGKTAVPDLDALKPHIESRQDGVYWVEPNTDKQTGEIINRESWLCSPLQVIGTPDKAVLFSGRSSAAAGYTCRGSAESWRQNVGALAAGNYSMMTGIAAALAAPLIGLAGADGFGIHFYEQSSAGKTTTANVASSLYGNPDQLRLTWYGTALGLANEAAAHNDALMPLDEVGQGADPVSVSQSAYALFNGVGKLQGAKEGGNRDLKRWRTVAISTGEMDLETFIAMAGRKAKAGQLVRLLNIPLSKAVRFHQHANGKQHADALKDAWQNHHGAAGKEWIKWLAGNQRLAIEAVRNAEERWRSLIPAEYGEQVHRVGARFAILEAALLLGRVITGWDEQTCRDAIQHSYNAWVREFGTGNKEHQQIIAQCEAFLNANGYSRFAPFPYDPQSLPVRDMAGYRASGSHDDDPIVFYTFPATFEQEIASGFNPKQFARVLVESGMLTPPASGRGYQRKSPRINKRQYNVYVIQYRPEDESAEE